MLKVKIFRSDSDEGSVEEAFNEWSSNTDMKIATAQFVASEQGVEKLIVFYEEKEQTFTWPKGPRLAEAEVEA